MAVWPLRHHGKGSSARVDLARLPVLVAAFLIALFGFLPGTPRNTDIAASARPMDDRSDRSPVLAKRDPIRAVAVAERKDGAGGHFPHDDGFLPASSILPTNHDPIAARAPCCVRMTVEDGTWPGVRARAPPLAA
jgi:hypothetical protein